ncbi:GlsB/YeaQ/YmgE family stress response membrane protein [Citricoccus nitrophenolicus]|uniref:Putative membrane protein YeaQ/YmgE (Transglycosylase-associated protein family) n=1 Tax=Citricoccus muralis TaxID=169134 RepID=A0A3D9LE73_9MICC|nr:GlsB/YeaQ/YmgE family stress response membrane protein [Citricoccus muralis]REE03453.1 putative membrane protein YeaQ/YmgE (transglycosylase-associated protein family) [Citricoccus muralis]
MGFISWIILGLIAGVIARLILPGKQGGGWLTALITGLIGAVLGGWIASLLGMGAMDEFWSFGTWIFAIIGGVIVAFAWQAITRRTSHKEA